MKNYKSYTPTRRHATIADKSALWKGSSEKILTKKYISKGGRNNQGVITSRHRGGGHKKKYRLIDFKRNKKDMPAKVLRIEYDPIRTAYIALIEYEDKIKSYIIAPQKLKIGDTVVSGDKVNVRVGNAMPLKNIPVGTIIHNIEMKPGKGAQIARSAGTFVNLLAKNIYRGILIENTKKVPNAAPTAPKPRVSIPKNSSGIKYKFIRHVKTNVKIFSPADNFNLPAAIIIWREYGTIILWR